MIPRILHQIWVGPPLPDYMAEFSRQWSDMHPEWQVSIWGDNDLDWLENRRLYDEAESYVPADAVGQFRSDVARYEILLKHGGVYIDFDTEPLKSIEPLTNVPGFAVWEVKDKYLANGIIGAHPGDEFLRLLVDRLPVSADKNRGRPATFLSGPRFLSDLFFEAKPDWATYPTVYFLPYLHSDVVRGARPERGDYPDSYAVHHWNHRRQMQNVPLKDKS